MANPKIDWQKARDEYIKTKEMSLKGISKRYGVSYSRVRTIAQNEGWGKEKEKQWDEAAKDALIESQGSIKDLISRHAKIARFLQAGGLREIKKKLEAMESDPIIGLKTSIRDLLALVAEGLKAERELYPKQMQFEGDVSVDIGISKELKKAVYEVLKKELRKKRPTSKRPAGSKS